MQNKLKANQLQFFPLENHDSAESFLLTTFQCSKNKLKKYFDKKFLSRKLEAHRPINLDLNFINDGLISPVYIGPKIEIIEDNESFIVLNKPENIFVHPLTYFESDNCLSFLRSINHPSLVNEQNYDRGLLYRLDYETSGVLVLTKDESIYQSVRQNFDQLVKQKIYILVVEGELKHRGLIETYIQASMQAGSTMKIVNQHDDMALRAQLEILESEYDAEKNLSKVKVKLLTGHRHQIRIQMKGLGHPILGDKLYGGREASRMYLHAFEYQLSIQNKSYLWKANPNNWL